MPYFAFFNSPFFTPASGKIHIATTMKTAVTMTKIEKSGRIGEPLHQARTAATIRTMTETAALTSLGMASARVGECRSVMRNRLGGHPLPAWGEGGVRGLPAHRETITPHPTPLPTEEGADRACGAFVHQFTGTRFQCEPTGTAAASSRR